jgi:type IV pilus assembly protein PilV
MAAIMRDEHGMSLLEVMITMLVLTIGLLGMMPLFATSMKANYQADKTTVASEIAQAKIEDFKTLVRQGDYDLIVSGVDYPPGMVRRVWTVTDDTPSLDIKTVDVTVEWTDESGNLHSLTFSTYVAEERFILSG